MFTTSLTKLSRASLVEGVLLIVACLLLSVSQAEAQTRKARARTGKARVQTEKTLTPALSLAEVTLKPKAKLIVILGTGENIKGRADKIGDETLSIKIATNQFTFPRDYKTRRFSESEIFQIVQAKGTSRGRGALRGALIGAASLTGVLVLRYPGLLQGDASERLSYLGLSAIVGGGFGAAIGALVSGEKKGLIYQNPAVAPPSGLKTGLLNFRDNRLSFAVPSVNLRPDNFDRFSVTLSNKNTKHIDLVRVDF